MRYDIVGCGAVAQLYHVPIIKLLRKQQDVTIADGALIATTPDLHAQIAAEYIDSGKGVFVEKPLTVTSGEAQELVDRSRRAGVRVVVNRFWRPYPSVNVARRRRRGRYDHVTSVEATEGFSRRVSCSRFRAHPRIRPASASPRGRRPVRALPPPGRVLLAPLVRAAGRHQRTRSGTHGPRWRVKKRRARRRTPSVKQILKAPTPPPRRIAISGCVWACSRSGRSSIGLSHGSGSRRLRRWRLG
jgi:Oxidoreductase family, NAD-binding Rossmann fold